VLTLLCTMPWRRRREWRWMVSFTLRPIYPRGRAPSRRLGRPQNWSGRCEEKSLAPTGNRTPTIQYVAIQANYIHYEIYLHNDNEHEILQHWISRTEALKCFTFDHTSTVLITPLADLRPMRMTSLWMSNELLRWENQHEARSVPDFSHLHASLST
jgi:hypothetical protein